MDLIYFSRIKSNTIVIILDKDKKFQDAALEVDDV